MSWETSIKGFKSYLQIERSLSDNYPDKKELIEKLNILKNEIRI